MRFYRDPTPDEIGDTTKQWASGPFVIVEVDRETLVKQITGLLSTIEFSPHDGHPLALGLYADTVVALVEETLGIGGDE
jgi:hypothetical protein